MTFPAALLALAAIAVPAFVAAGTWALCRAAARPTPTPPGDPQP